MRAAFAGLLTAAGAVTGVSLAVVLALGRSLAACYVDAVPMGDGVHLCGRGPWGPEWVPVVAFAGAVLILAATTTATVAVLMRQFGGASRFARRLARRQTRPPTRLATCAQRAGVQNLVYIDADTVVAVTAGFLRPRVLVTKGLVDLLSDDEVVAVLLHERAHVRRRHPAIYGLARAAAATSFAFPAIQPLARRVVLHSEVAADAAAVAEQGLQPLARALGKLMGVVEPVDVTAVGGVQGMLDERIRALAGHDYGLRGRSRPLPTLLASLVIAAPAVALAVSYAFVKGYL